MVYDKGIGSFFGGFMLDNWIEDIENALHKTKGVDFKSATLEDIFIGNLALLKLATSYIWKNGLEDSRLMVSSKDPRFCFLKIMGYEDPYTGKDMRDESYISIYSSKLSELIDYHYEEGDYEIYNMPDMDTFSPCEKINKKDFSICEHILKELKKDEYYSKLLEEESDKIQKNITELSNLSFQFVNEDRYFDEIPDISRISSNDCFGMRTVFGHAYFHSHDSNRHLIIAKNWLGPVGVLSLFDRGREGVSRKCKDLYSISYLSVTPAFRGQGIAVKLIDEAIKIAKEKQKILVRSEPSPMGEEKIYKKITRFTNENHRNFPIIPFYLSEKANIILNNELIRDLSYKNKTKIIVGMNNFMNKKLHNAIETMSPRDLAYDENVLMYLDEWFSKTINKLKDKSIDHDELIL